MDNNTEDLRNTDWQVKFREKFWWGIKGNEAGSGYDSNKFSTSECAEIESFIRSLISRIAEQEYKRGRREEREGIERVMVYHPQDRTSSPSLSERDAGRNDALA